MSKRVKSDAANCPVPQSRDEVSTAIAEMGVAQRERTRIEAEMNDEMAVVKSKYEKLAAPYKTQIESLMKGVQTWCEANRMAITKDGKVKFANFAGGEVKWRMRPTKVVIRGAENVIETLTRMGLTRFIRVKQEVNKEQMLVEPEVVKGLAGVKFEQGEDFAVVPFETSLEEVA